MMTDKDTLIPFVCAELQFTVWTFVCYVIASLYDHWYQTTTQNKSVSINSYRAHGYGRVYLPYCKVADTPFNIQGDDMYTQ